MNLLNDEWVLSTPVGVFNAKTILYIMDTNHNTLYYIGIDPIYNICNKKAGDFSPA
ncbi:hypothetical protein GCM10023163_29410 [Aestuariibaculum suncheonense]